jgi:hypothetical protein
MSRFICSLVCTGLFYCAGSMAQDAAGPPALDQPAPSTRQLMKDCMDKQKASESGKSTEDMRKLCRDLTKTEKENSDRAAGDRVATPTS